MSVLYRIAIPSRYEKNYWTGVDIFPALYPTQKQIDEYKNWCKINVGTNGWNYYGQYRKIPFEFRFKRSEDLLAFKIKFGLHSETDSI